MCDAIGHPLIVSPLISHPCICCLCANFGVSANEYQNRRLVMGIVCLDGYLGLCAIRARRPHMAPGSQPLSFEKPGFLTPSPVEEAARIWLFACLAASAIRIIPHAFWQDDWDRRHAEIRLVLGAMAAVVLVKWPPFYRLTTLQLTTLGYTLAATCWVGLGVTAMYGRETPLHAIAWAVSLSFWVCLLAPMVLNNKVAVGHRRFGH